MSDIEPRIPLALFTYNRPAHTAAVLESLHACKGREQFDFFFFSDAAYRHEDRASVQEVRRLLLEQAPLFNAKIIKQSTNQGLAQSIVSGVSRLCSSYGWVVVLEDDLLVEPQFLQFMAEALVHYKNSPAVMQVAATTLAPPLNPPCDAFLLPVTTTWGWGTWQRAWESFSWVPKGWPQSANDADWLSAFQVGGAMDYVSMLEDRLAGHNDSWGILWWYAVSRAQGKVVYPTRSLVKNIGFDGTGIHCGKGTPYKSQYPSVADDSQWLVGKPNFPNDENVDPDHYQLLQEVFARSAQPVPTWAVRWKNQLFALRRQLRRALA